MMMMMMMMVVVVVFVCSERRRRVSTEANSVDVYLAACDRNQVAPQVAIMRGLPEHGINVRHRCLGDEDAHALSTALCVREHAARIDRLFLSSLCCSFVY